MLLLLDKGDIMDKNIIKEVIVYKQNNRKIKMVIILNDGSKFERLYDNRLLEALKKYNVPESRILEKNMEDLSNGYSNTKKMAVRLLAFLTAGIMATSCASKPNPDNNKTLPEPTTEKTDDFITEKTMPYYAQPNDSLTSIALKYGLNLSAILELNGYDMTKRLEIGEEVLLPLKSIPLVKYKIKEGDTLTAIANKYNTSVPFLVSINPMANPNLLHIGSEITIPASIEKVQKDVRKTETTPTRSPSKQMTPTPQLVEEREPLFKGIDVSQYQGNINYEELLKENIDFMIIRVGDGYFIENNQSDKLLDPYFKRNKDQCKKYNIPYGFYYVTHAETVQAADREVQYLLEQIDGLNPTYPIYLDLETNRYRELIQQNPKLVIDIILHFCNTLEANGFCSGIYSSYYTLRDLIKIYPDLKKFQLWVAYYSDNSKRGYDEVSIHSQDYGLGDVIQVTDKGTVRGIEGTTDINYARENYPKYTRRYYRRPKER